MRLKERSISCLPLILSILLLSACGSDKSESEGASQAEGNSTDQQETVVSDNGTSGSENTNNEDTTNDSEVSAPNDEGSGSSQTEESVVENPQNNTGNSTGGDDTSTTDESEENTGSDEEPADENTGEEQTGDTGSNGGDGYTENNDSEIRSKANIVFSGHSLTDAAVPTIKAIATQQGKELNSIYQSYPGSPIRVRTRGQNPSNEQTWSGFELGLNGTGVSNLLDEFRNPTQLPVGEHYDTLVITERHDILETIQYEDTVSLLLHYYKRFPQSSDLRVLFYNSWYDIDSTNPELWINYEKNAVVAWQCVTSKLNSTLVHDYPPKFKTLGAGWALANMVELAIAGSQGEDQIDGIETIKSIKGSRQEIVHQIFAPDPWRADNIRVHLTPLGDFFVGAFSYISIFGERPENVSIPSGISQETGEELLYAASRLVAAYNSMRSDFDMNTCQSHITNNMCRTFYADMSNRPDKVDSCMTFFEIKNDPAEARQSRNPLSNEAVIKDWFE